MADTIVDTLKKLHEGSKKRNFSQTFDIIVNLKNINPKKPEGKLNEVFELPNGRGKEASIAVFSDSLKGDGYSVMPGADIEKLGKDKHELKRVVKSTDFFLSEAKLMPVVGKNLGLVLAPRGKMPTVIAGSADAMVKKFKRSTHLKIKDSPVIQSIVGTEALSDEKVAQNIDAVIKFLEKKLPKGRNNIRNVMVKLTMGKPIKIVV
jgi:large subunit ribosomal protein L1